MAQRSLLPQPWRFHMVASNPQPRRSALFPLGSLVATPGALAALEQGQQLPMTFLSRHVTGDWGTVCDDDKKLNDRSVKNGTRTRGAVSNQRRREALGHHRGG